MKFMEFDYILAPKGWNHADPVFAGVGEKCTCLYFLDRNDEAVINGSGGNGIFTFAAGRNVAGLKYRVADFLRYENRQGRQVIVGADYDFDVASFIAEADKTTPPEPERRLNDPAIVVHSTNLASLESILRDREIKSSFLLKETGKDFITLGYDKLCEPPEYNQYVHYGPMDSCYTEAIILSQQQGEICTDPNAPYIPGARLYLAHHKMIDDGIVTRDGLHAGKVKGSIDLNKYLLGVISAGDIVGNEDSWMPRKFSEMANEAFKKGK